MKPFFSMVFFPLASSHYVGHSRHEGLLGHSVVVNGIRYSIVSHFFASISPRELHFYDSSTLHLLPQGASRPSLPVRKTWVLPDPHGYLQQSITYWHLRNKCVDDSLASPQRTHMFSIYMPLAASDALVNKHLMQAFQRNTFILVRRWSCHRMV